MSKKTIHYFGESEILYHYIKNKIPHQLILTANTATIKTEKRTIVINDQQLKPQYLGFIKSVKNEAIKMQEYEPDLFLSQGRPHYIKPGKNFLEKKSIADVLELDLNSAYWETAYKMGYLSKKNYLKGIEGS